MVLRETGYMYRRGLFAFVLACIAIGACAASEPAAAPRRVAGGRAEEGRRIVANGTYGCTGCHAVPGIAAPRGIVGPPLGGMARRAFIAGQLPNEPTVLVAFLQDPPALVPATGMPNVRLSLADARHVAAYLYTLDISR